VTLGEPAGVGDTADALVDSATAGVGLDGARVVGAKAVSEGLTTLGLALAVLTVATFVGITQALRPPVLIVVVAATACETRRNLSNDADHNDPAFVGTAAAAASPVHDLGSRLMAPRMSRSISVPFRASISSRKKSRSHVESSV
jgi:hypothetical protein